MTATHGTGSRSLRRIVHLVALSVAASLSWQICFGGAVHGARSFPDISGVWWIVSYGPHFTPLGGNPIPFTPEGKTRYEQNLLNLKRSSAADSAHSTCVPQGIPRVLGSPYPFQIVQSVNQLGFIYEVNRAFRYVLMTSKHQDPAEWDPSYMGDGIGHWDNDVLVIDTTNFNAETWLDDSGLPHSDRLHTVERLQTLQAARELEDTVTINDPEMFFRAWAVRLLYRRRPDVTVSTDWVCGEAHRSVAQVFGGKGYR
ncbi:MAG: hypothetical protein ACRD22_02140 [Terriglobia bacterium]